MHPFLYGIAALLTDCALITVRHINREANLVADWIISYIVEHLEDFFWTDMGEVLGQLHNIVLSDFLGYIYNRLI